MSRRGSADTFTPQDSLDELARLAASVGVEVVGRMVQVLPAPTRGLYIGTGKLEELLAMREVTGYDVVIFDDELSPLQQRNLENALKVKVIDRVALILDVFGRRAHTREGQLQVELAQHQYLAPRLAGQWSHLERLGGGIGTRGPGESQLETDRRLIQRRIHQLQQRLEKVRRQRELYRQHRRRSGIPQVALVGYTNAGKSTLLNALSGAGVLSEDRLFSTLDPTTRRVVLPGRTTVLLSDTVGFIRKLPPTIISAFRATLEELQEASLLLHLVDLTSHNAAEECTTVEAILRQLNLERKPRLTVLNKIDLLLDPAHPWTEKEAIRFVAASTAPEQVDAVLISASRGWGLRHLCQRIEELVAG